MRVRFVKFLLLALLACAQLSCGGKNYLESMADKDSDEALYYGTLKLVDKKMYSDALAMLNRTSSSFQRTYPAVQTKAGIYAGLCGLDFLSFASNLSGSGVFGLFMSGFTSLPVSIAHCQSAQDTIESAFGTTGATRIANLGDAKGGSINTFMAVLGMAKIGAQLRVEADADQDGSVDGGFDACNMTQSHIEQVGTGFALLLDNFTMIVSQLSPGSAGLLTNIQTTCANPLLNPNPCTVTSPTDPTWANAGTQMAIKSLVKSNTTGIQNCSADNPMNPLPFPFDCCP